MQLLKKVEVYPFACFYCFFECFLFYKKESTILTKGNSMDELQSIVTALLPLLKEKLKYTESVINLWFSDLNLVELTEEKALFITATKLKKNILSTKYKKVIEESLEEVIGFPVNAIFELSEEAKYFTEDASRVTDIPSAESTVETEKKERIINESINDTGNSLLAGYTFENFIEGASNKFARAACMAVAKEPTTYNPLFIYGQSGLGKTHLLYAVINYIKENHPHMKIVYKKSEEFINELILAIQNGTTTQFKDKYRAADVLLIDDIQFIAGKVSTQEEFFHTFTALYESEKQIILTSDRPPNEIKPLEDRLLTRFEGGLLADVQPPSFELRTAIIRKKADMMNLDISDAHVNYMAERLQNNIRQIEGVMKRLRAMVEIEHKTITEERIEEIITAIDPGNIPTSVMVDRIITAVCERYGVSADDLKSKNKSAHIANARHVAIYLVRTMTQMQYTQLGQIFGNRNHSTIMSSEEKVKINIKTVKNFEVELSELIKKIRG